MPAIIDGYAAFRLQATPTDALWLRRMLTPLPRQLLLRPHRRLLLGRQYPSSLNSLRLVLPAEGLRRMLGAYGPLGYPPPSR